MALLAGRLKPPATLLAGLILLTLVSVSAVGWFGWTLLEQERLVESQRLQEKLEQAADNAVASVRQTLAETGELLGDRGTARAPGPGLLLHLREEPEAAPAVFAEGEMFEFLHGQPEEALLAYRKQAASERPEIRAGALLRIARVQRNLGRMDAARNTYAQLARMDGVKTAGVPASLVASSELARLTGKGAEAVRSDLLRGRWPLTRGRFEFYWAQNSAPGQPAPPVESMALSELAAQLWEERQKSPETRGQRSLWISGKPYFLIWRGPPERRSVLIVEPAPFLKSAFSAEGVSYAATDGEGRLLAGERTGARAAVRAAAENDLPWTISVSDAQPLSRAGFLQKQKFLIAGISIMVLFLTAGTYLIARAIRREAAVLRMQSDFVSAVSHEFRSPLTSLRQLSEILALGRVPSEERRQLYYDTLVNETTRLQRVVEALLNFGRMEAGARQYHFEELDAAQLVRRVVAEFDPQMTASGRRIEVSAASGCAIDADPDAICVALRNLLDNAIKYSPGAPVVWVECGLEQRKVTIKVRDEGPGVPDSERKEIFGKFVRGSAARAGNVKGSGVGLAMVRHIISAHGGEVTVISNGGAGSTFALLLPPSERTCHEY